MFNLEQAARDINDILQGGDDGGERRRALNATIEREAYHEAAWEMRKRHEFRGNMVHVGDQKWFAKHMEELEGTELYALYYSNMSTMWAQALSMAATQQRAWQTKR